MQCSNATHQYECTYAVGKKGEKLLDSENQLRMLHNSPFSCRSFDGIAFLQGEISKEINDLRERSLIGRRLTAELTRIWSRITVNQKVCREGARSLKSFSALFALENFLDVVNGSVGRIENTTKYL